MKNTLIAVLALAVAVPGISRADEIADKYPGYTLAWNEEFESGTRPSTRDWEYEVGYKRNNEAQYYTTKNATIADGKLVIEARKNDDGHDYTSSSIIAKKRFHYGIYEVCAKIPVGTGYWPAIWGTGNKYEWPYNGEIDMMEYYGDALHANVAWGSSTRWQAQWNSKAPRMSNFAADFADHYHVWKMVFTYETIKLYVDDELLNMVNLDQTVNPNPRQSWYNVDNYNPYRDESNTFGVWLNLALGGNCGGSLTNTAFPAQYYVDYVRVYVPDANPFGDLSRVIEEANKLYNSTAEGDEPGQYPKDARDEFKAAIDAASAVSETASTAEIEAAIAALNAAIAAYKAAEVPEPPFVLDAGVYRMFEHNSSMYISSGVFNPNTNYWKTDEHGLALLPDNRVNDSDFNQEFTFTPNGDGYNISDPDDNYLYCSGNWDLRMTDNASKLNNAEYIFSLEREGDKVVVKTSRDRHIGFDKTTAMAPLYSDKSGNARCLVTLERVDAPAGISTVSLNAIGSSAVYNLTGLRVADSVESLRAKGLHGVFIVVEGNTSRKVAL